MTIANVPSGLTSEMNQFLKDVKNQIELREGLRPNARDQRFLSIKDIQSLIDDHSVRAEKGKERAGKIQEGEKVNLTPLLSKISRLDIRLEAIESRRILNLQIKEGVFVNTFIHVGENDPSDEAWQPIGTGIHAEGIYSVNGPVGSETGRFLLASKDANLTGRLQPYFGNQIWGGEFRVGDNVKYNSVSGLLDGDDWMWYRQGQGLLIQLSTGGVRVGNHYPLASRTGTAVDIDGLFIYQDGTMRHGFAVQEKTSGENTLYPFDAMIGDYFSGSGILWDNNEERLNIKITSGDGLRVGSWTSETGCIFGADGMFLYRNGIMRFGVTLSPTNTQLDNGGAIVPAYCVMIGDYYGPTQKGLLYNHTTGDFELRGIDLNMFGGSITISQVSDAGELASKNNVSWTANEVINIPQRFSDSATTGLNLTASYLGYYTGSEWRSYIDHEGNFQFKGNDNHMIQWNVNTGSLYISGRLIIQNPTEVQPTITAYNVSGAGTLLQNNTLTVQGSITISGTVGAINFDNANIRVVNFGSDSWLRIQSSPSLTLDTGFLRVTGHIYISANRNIEPLGGSGSLGTTIFPWGGLNVSASSHVQIGSAGSLIRFIRYEGGVYHSEITGYIIT